MYFHALIKETLLQVQKSLGKVDGGKKELSVAGFSISLKFSFHRDGLRIIKKWASVQLPVMLSNLIPLAQIYLYEEKQWNKMLA